MFPRRCDRRNFGPRPCTVWVLRLVLGVGKFCGCVVLCCVPAGPVPVWCGGWWLFQNRTVGVEQQHRVSPHPKGWGCWLSPRPISTSPLNTLPCVHVWPINPVVCRGPYPISVGGRPHLEEGFPLRCFQRLSRPDVANQPCTWRYNWHTRGPSIPVLSY